MKVIKFTGLFCFFNKIRIYIKFKIKNMIYKRMLEMKEEKEIEFEQYKLFIESAEKTSDKRITQNNIYLTINLAFISYK